MRILLAALLIFGVVSASVADIHEPPKARYTKARKLGRGISNIVYGWTEVPMTMARWQELHTEQSTGIVTAGFLQGVQRAGARLKYGFYEVINFSARSTRTAIVPRCRASITSRPTVTRNFRLRSVS